MDPSNYNGGTAIAMTGKNCFCIGSDLRFGEAGLTVAVDMPKVHKLGDTLYVAICGFQSDNITVLDRLKYRKNLYELRENREVKPMVLTTMLSNLLYERRFGPYFIGPIVAGIYEGKPQIYSTDLIGNVTSPRDFVVCGGAEEEMFGGCEAYWRPEMTEDETFEATSQALLAGLERVANSGWGCVVYTVTEKHTTVKVLKARMD